MFYENVAISLEAARDMLVRGGQHVDAKSLVGLEVHTPAGAKLALEALRHIKPTTPEVKSALDWAISACVGASFIPAA